MTSLETDEIASALELVRKASTKIGDFAPRESVGAEEAEQILRNLKMVGNQITDLLDILN